MATVSDRFVWLAKFEPLDLQFDMLQELWIASQHISVVNEQAGDPPSGVVPGLLIDPHSLSINALNADNLVATRSLPSLGDVTFGNPDGRFDEILGWTFAQRKVTMWRGLEGETFWRDPPLWSALTGEPTAERHEITVPTIGIEELLRRPFQVNRYTPGFEPYVVLPANPSFLDNFIDFGNNLSRASASFIFGVAFRTSTLQTAGLYGKSPAVAPTNPGYQIGLVSSGAIRLSLHDGDELATVTHTPAGGYDTGERISLIGRVQRGTDTAFLYVNLNDGSGWTQVGSADISTLGSVSNAETLTAGATNSGTSEFLDGEIERMIQISPATASDLTTAQDALDERFSEDVDASGLDHYVPLSENTGLTAGDLSPSAIDGTISGTGLEADGNSSWSGLVNGTRDLDGVPKPKGLGRVFYARPRLLDPVKQVYQYQDVGPDGQTQNLSVAEFLDRGQSPGIPESITLPNNIFTERPTSPNDWLFDPQRGLVRVFPPGGSDPSVLAVAFEQTATGNKTAEELFSYVLDTLHGFEVTGVLGGQNYDVAFYHDGERDVTIGEVIDEIVSSVGASWAPAGRDPFLFGVPRFKLFPVSEPLAGVVLKIRIDGPIEEADALIAEDGLRRVGVVPVLSAVNLEYARYHGHYSENELLQFNLSPRTIPNDLLAEFRQVRSDAPQAVLDRFIESEPLKKRTGISTALGNVLQGLSDAGTQAQAEANRLVDLHGQLVEVWECDVLGAVTEIVFGRTGAFDIWVGEVVTVEGSLPTFEAGRQFLVVGVRENADDAGSTLTLWGPRPGTAP